MVAAGILNPECSAAQPWHPAHWHRRAISTAGTFYQGVAVEAIFDYTSSEEGMVSGYSWDQPIENQGSFRICAGRAFFDCRPYYKIVIITIRV